MKKVKILFQGDSITDGRRDKRNYHEMGSSYPKYAAELISEAHPDTEFEFINFGIGGNRTCQVADRLYVDGIAFKPDIFSILVGINDIWHRTEENGYIATTDKQIETNYRAILERLKKETDAKIIMLQPYLLDAEVTAFMREDLDKVIPIVDELAKEFADVYIPLDERFAEAMKTQPVPRFYSVDGVHPNENGARFIGELYAEAVDSLLK